MDVQKHNLGVNLFLRTFYIGVDFRFHDPFPRVFGGFLERRIPGKNGEVTPGLVEKSMDAEIPMWRHNLGVKLV